MKNFLIAFLVFLLYAVFGMWYHACILKGLCDSKAPITTIKTKDEKPFKASEVVNKPQTIKINNLSSDGFIIRDHDQEPIFSFSKNILINRKEGSVFIPQETLAFKDSIFSYLNSNQNKELVITGLRTVDESPTIGLDRAKEIKAILEDFGVNSDKISVKDTIANFQFDDANNFKGGINFTLKELSAKRLSEIESGIANKTLYSGFASKGFKPDNTLKAYALELKNYLNKYPTKKAIITGHTDSVGDNVANDWFGMERAKNVKKYLISQGISENKLTALSNGETQPIATNGTLEGRRKNRRIEINVN